MGVYISLFDFANLTVDSNPLPAILKMFFGPIFIGIFEIAGEYI
ncbi:MAG: hypothetical protein VXY28_07635 [Bacteroidota bacterium]|nr:hypothetical protein [Bacteroidota bacterium]